MRIKDLRNFKWLRRKRALLLAVPLVLFFGFIGYRDLFFDGAAAVEHELSAKVEAAKGADEESHLPEYYGYRRAEIALQEYRKNVVEQERGCNCGPEVDKYTEGLRVQWCTMFVSWIAKEAGSPLWNDRTNSWRIGNSRNLANYLEEYGTWYSREEVIATGAAPQVGDIVVFWRGSFEDNLGHADIVVEVGQYPGTASLVGGNLNDRVAYRGSFPYLQHYGFLGFGRPEK